MALLRVESETSISDLTTSDYDRSSYSKSSLSSQEAARWPTHDSHPNTSNSTSSDTSSDPDLRFPYVVGFTATATRHEPPEPFGLGYETDGLQSLDIWETLSKLDYCLNSPIVGRRATHDDTKFLTITGIIRAGGQDGAQLVIINETMVAKIYDPLYYDGFNMFGYKEDVVSNAASDYSIEAAAYYELQKSPAARKVTPTFYGTWIMEVETLIHESGQTRKHMRQVPFVLIEYLQGEPMANIDAYALSEETRPMVLKKVLHVGVVIYQAGIVNEDFCPRNIMITGLREAAEHGAEEEIVVKAIDFNASEVRSHPQWYNAKFLDRIESAIRLWHPKISSPIYHFYNCLTDFSILGWCPHEEGKANLWLWEQFSKDERYIPVVWDPAHPHDRPKYVGFGSNSYNSVDSGLGPHIHMEGEKDEEVCDCKDSGHVKE